jgi:hypothetical protein
MDQPFHIRLLSKAAFYFYAPRTTIEEYRSSMHANKSNMPVLDVRYKLKMILYILTRSIYLLNAGMHHAIVYTWYFINYKSKEWNIRLSTFMGGQYTLNGNNSCPVEWQNYIDNVWKTMRIFETVLADSRASVKGYLTAGCIVAAIRLAKKHISQIKCLVSIITELQLDHPISLISNGTF